MVRKDSALDETSINKLILEIGDYSEKIKLTFNKINDLMDDAKISYKCSSATKVFNRYSEFNDNYNIIVKNILSYQTDLINLKRKFKSNVSEISQNIRKDSTSVNTNVGYKEEY